MLFILFVAGVPRNGEKVPQIVGGRFASCFCLWQKYANGRVVISMLVYLKDLKGSWFLWMGHQPAKWNMRIPTNKCSPKKVRSVFMQLLSASLVSLWNFMEFLTCPFDNSILYVLNLVNGEISADMMGCQKSWGRDTIDP